jgi:isopentenyl-diphosphate delta-isomerase
MDYVILVNDRDEETGIMEKMQAHREGRMHRAISIFIFDTNGKLLLQQRALTKYHSAGLWTNTCCSHPRPGESNLDAANRRLKEEMGLQCPLMQTFSFTYHSMYENGMTEYEFDYVFLGVTDALPVPDPKEAQGFRYVDLKELEEDMDINPHTYTSWFKICMPPLKKYMQTEHVNLNPVFAKAV